MLTGASLVILAVLAFAWPVYIMRSDKFGAPYVPMEPEVVERVMRLAKVKKGDVFYDLGSGDGRLVIAAALHGAQAYGVEIDRWRVLYSRLWIWLLRLSPKAKIIRRDFFKIDLSKANVVALFLLQETNQKLKKKLKKELKPGTRLVSYAFTFENWKPLGSVKTKGAYGRVYLYEISLRN